MLAHHGLEKNGERDDMARPDAEMRQLGDKNSAKPSKKAR
jgi:hypothetical protein